MVLEHLPLLKIQRELLDQPRGFERFRAYLKTMVAQDGTLAVPLPAFNPMSKGHVGELIDRLLALDAEGIAVQATRESESRLAGSIGLRNMPAYRVGLVVADDAQGGWTNRYLFDAKDRFENKYALKHGFITPLLWSSETADAMHVAQQTAGAIFRTAWLWTRGLPRTLGEMLRQEGMAARFAGVVPCAVDSVAAELVKRHIGSTDYPVLMACLYGDDVAETLGYPRIGMPHFGGLRYASSDGFLGGTDPVAALKQAVK